MASADVEPLIDLIAENLFQHTRDRYILDEERKKQSAKKPKVKAKASSKKKRTKKRSAEHTDQDAVRGSRSRTLTRRRSSPNIPRRPSDLSNAADLWLLLLREHQPEYRISTLISAASGGRTFDDLCEREHLLHIDCGSLFIIDQAQ